MRLHRDAATGGRRRLRFVAVGRAARLAFVAARGDKARESAVGPAARASEAFPFRARRALTGGGAGFAARRHGARASRASRAQRPPTALPLPEGARRRLAALHAPQADGMAERFVGPVEAGAAERAERPSRPAPEADLLAWRASRSRRRPHGGLRRRTPLEEAQRWRKEGPGLVRRGRSQPNGTGHLDAFSKSRDPASCRSGRSSHGVTKRPTPPCLCASVRGFHAVEHPLSNPRLTKPPPATLRGRPLGALGALCGEEDAPAPSTNPTSERVRGPTRIHVKTRGKRRAPQ